MSTRFDRVVELVRSAIVVIAIVLACLLALGLALSGIGTIIFPFASYVYIGVSDEWTGIQWCLYAIYGAIPLLAFLVIGMGLIAAASSIYHWIERRI